MAYHYCLAIFFPEAYNFFARQDLYIFCNFESCLWLTSFFCQTTL